MGYSNYLTRKKIGLFLYRCAEFLTILWIFFVFWFFMVPIKIIIGFYLAYHASMFLLGLL